MWCLASYSGHSSASIGSITLIETSKMVSNGFNPTLSWLHRGVRGILEPYGEVELVDFFDNDFVTVQEIAVRPNNKKGEHIRHIVPIYYVKRTKISPL